MFYLIFYISKDSLMSPFMFSEDNNSEATLGVKVRLEQVERG